MDAARRFAPFIVLALTSCRPASSTTPEPATQTQATTTTTDDAPPTAPALAKVGGGVVPLVDFDALLALKLEKYTVHDREPPQSAVKRYRTALAKRLVHAEQLRQACRAAGVKLDPAAIAQRLDEAKQGIPDWNEHLRRRGETEHSLRAMYESDLCSAALLERTPITVSEEEIAAAYEAEHAKVLAREGWVRFATAATTRAPNSESITPACDDYIFLYRRCITEKVPDAARKPMTDALDETVKVWREAANGPARDGLDTACKAASDAAAQATKQMGCDWTPPRNETPMTKAELSAAKKKLMAFRSAASKPGADFVALAKTAGLDVRVDAMLVPRESVVGDAHSVLSRLKPGELGKPMNVDGSFQVIQLLDVEPPGALPLTRVHDTIAAKLRAQKSKAAAEQLEAQLDRDHPVQYQIAIE